MPTIQEVYDGAYAIHRAASRYMNILCDVISDELDVRPENRRTPPKVQVRSAGAPGTPKRTGWVTYSPDTGGWTCVKEGEEPTEHSFDEHPSRLLHAASSYPGFD